MKQSKNRRWLSALLVCVMLLSAGGCAARGEQDSGSADNSSERYAVLMGAKKFKDTYRTRGDMTDHAESAEDESGISLLVSNIDGRDNIFYYLDATGEVDLDDMEKEKFVPDFLERLNKTSDAYHYSDMELLSRGANYYEYKVTIADSQSDETTEEALSSAEESVPEKNPMVFLFVEKGEKTLEVIGLDMEAEDDTAFSESFQEILDEIVVMKEVSEGN